MDAPRHQAQQRRDAAPARLIDLSAARTAAAAAALQVAVGTDAWMAPEQCLPGERGVPGPASDVFGLAATVFTAAAGYRPFDEGDPASSDPAGQWPQPRDAPYDLPRSVPAPVAEVLLAGLAPEPRDRPSPVEVAETVEPVFARLPQGRLPGFRTR